MTIHLLPTGEVLTRALSANPDRPSLGGRTDTMLPSCAATLPPTDLAIGAPRSALARSRTWDRSAPSHKGTNLVRGNDEDLAGRRARIGRPDVPLGERVDEREPLVVADLGDAPADREAAPRVRRAHLESRSLPRPEVLSPRPFRLTGELSVQARTRVPL